MKAYSKDLHKKVVDAIQRGMPKAEAARAFGVGISIVKRYAGKAERGEPLEPAKVPGKRPKMDESVRKLLEEDLKPYVLWYWIKMRLGERSDVFIVCSLPPAILVWQRVKAHRL
jgi:transposase